MSLPFNGAFKSLYPTEAAAPPAPVYYYTFDGVADYVSIPVFSAVNAQIEFDVQLIALDESTGSAIIGYLNDTWVRLNNDGTLTFKVDTETNIYSLTEDWVANGMMHIKITSRSDITDCEVFIDDISQGVQPLNAVRTCSIDTIGMKDNGNFSQAIIKNLSLVDLDAIVANRFYPINDGPGTSIIQDTLGTGSTDGTAVSFDDLRWSV